MAGPPQRRTSRAPARGRRTARNRGRRRLATLIAVLVLALVGVGIALGTNGGGGDAPGAVSVEGVDVAGKDRAAVAAVVRQRAAALRDDEVVVTRTDEPGVRVAATRAALGARPRVRLAVDEALEPRSFGGRILSRLGIAPTRDVHLRWTLDPAKVAAFVRRVTGGENRRAVSAGLRVTDDDIVLTPARGGQGIDEQALRERIAAGDREISVTPGPIPPPVGDAAAEAAREEALRVVASPVSVELQGRGVTVETSVLRSALRFTPDPPRLRVGLDPDTLHARIKDAYSTREVPARDASFKVSGSTVRLVPSRIGRSLDMRAIAAEILANPGAPSVRARFTTTAPKVVTGQLKGLGITEEISEFTTPYNCCEPRVTNIQRAAAIIDGTIIPAGGRFSLNDALGQRTPDKGFVEAPQIAAGRLEDAVGGGVSQVATTLYNAAFFGGMELIAHTPHQFWISRYPPGREATVSYGGPELIFVNDWKAAVLISATAGSNAITIRFFSSKLGRRVETETGPKEDVVEPTTHETVDPSLAPGQRVVKQQLGGAGFTISYTRKVYVGDEVKRDERFTWKYDPEDEYVEVGPKRPTTPRPGRTTPAPGTTTSPPSTPTTSAPNAPSAPSQPSQPSKPSGGSGSGSAPPPPG